MGVAGHRGAPACAAAVGRASLDPRVHVVVRWAVPSAVYLAAFGQNLVDPFDAALPAKLGVAGVAVGAAL